MYIKRQNQSAAIGENWQFSCGKQGIINRDYVHDETKMNYELNPFFFRLADIDRCIRIVELSNAFIHR